MLAFWLAPVTLEAADASGLNNWVDRQAFPRGYSILTSEHLMFPVDVKDWPVRIDSRRQLFVDDYLISSMESLRREYHQPVKHPKNPLVVADRPWEGPELCVETVMRDASTGRFRMWYCDAKARQMYAESDDGIVWRKPELGLISHNGSKKNNIIIDNGYMIGLVENPAAADQSQRYVAMVCQAEPHVKVSGFYVYHSPDGIRWTGKLDWPALICSDNAMLYGSRGVGDTSIFRYDAMLGRYVVDAKFNLYLPTDLMAKLDMPLELGKNRIRSRATVESEDLIHWTRPRFTIFPDEHDERDAQIYGHIGFVYESMWLGILRVLHQERTGWKQVELEQTYSRDGLHWSRPAVRRPFIPLGAADSWDPDYSDPAHAGPLPVGDELWFYYRGSRSSVRDKKDRYTMSIGLATLRRDGFVSLDAGAAAGRLTTRPLTVPGRSLFVNADVASDGWVKAGVVSRDGNSKDGYRLENSIALKKGTTRGQMVWQGTEHLSVEKDTHVRLVFELKNATLYSFWIE